MIHDRRHPSLRRRLFLLFVLLLSCAAVGSLGGCWFLAGAVAAGAGVAYTMGDLEGVLDADVPTVAAAAEGALAELDLTVVSSEHSELEGEIVARSSTDERIKIGLKDEGAGRTKVSIRVGTMGDEAMSRRIFDGIRERI